MKKNLDYSTNILLFSVFTASGLFCYFFLCVIGGLTVPLFRENIFRSAASRNRDIHSVHTSLSASNLDHISPRDPNPAQNLLCTS